MKKQTITSILVFTIALTLFCAFDSAEADEQSRIPAISDYSLTNAVNYYTSDYLARLKTITPGERCIAVGVGITATNSLELAIGGWCGQPIKRTTMTPEEYEVICGVLARMK